MFDERNLFGFDEEFVLDNTGTSRPKEKKGPKYAKRRPMKAMANVTTARSANAQDGRLLSVVNNMLYTASIWVSGLYLTRVGPALTSGCYTYCTEL